MKVSDGIRARISRVFSAQIFNQMSTIVLQLALVPLLLHSWGLERYGMWLLLSAVPTYLTLSDFGFTYVAKNEMTMRVAAGDRIAALRTFQSVFALINLVAPAMFALALLLVTTVDVSAMLHLANFPLGEARMVLLLLILNVLLYQYALLICAGIRCENRAASEGTYSALMRLGEGGAIALAAFGSQSMVVAAAAVVANRVLFNLGGYIWLRRNTPWLKLGRAASDRGEIRRLIHPALAYMLMPVSQAIMLQGPVLLLGALANPVAVVVFSTSRTVARLGTAATNMLNNTVVTEYSAMLGRGARDSFERLFRLHLLASVGGIALYSLAVLLLDDRLLHILTHGKVTVIQPFFAIMVAAVAAEMLWTVAFTPISAANRHIVATRWLLGLSVAGNALCYPLIAALGLTGAALAVLGVNMAMCVVCIPLVNGGGRRGGEPAEPPIATVAETPGPAGEGRQYVV